MNLLDPEIANADDILAIYLVINETWNMSPGKIASQAFQACQRLHAAYERGEGTPEQRAAFEQWQAGGTRTIAKFAPTQGLFDRCCEEIDGETMVDEGLTEGTLGATIHATWPLRRGDLPRMLRHKRIKLIPRCIGQTEEPSSDARSACASHPAAQLVNAEAMS